MGLDEVRDKVEKFNKAIRELFAFLLIQVIRAPKPFVASGGGEESSGRSGNKCAFFPRREPREPASTRRRRPLHSDVSHVSRRSWIERRRRPLLSDVSHVRRRASGADDRYFPM